ncbi:MAG: YqzK family protein [Bacillaceae bacterium]|nr:YqzK family protein [Bacillaceae bacterium]
MKSMFESVYNTMKVFILFTGCTILFYYGIVWLNQEYENYHRYDVPEGAAVKVTKMVEEKNDSWVQRLLFFYHFGE